MVSIDLVWFGISFKQWWPTSFVSLVRRRAGMANIDLVWFGFSSKKSRPLTYLSSVRRRAGMASIDLVWFGLVFSPSNDDLWLTSAPWAEDQDGKHWFGLVWYFLQAMTTSDLPLLGEKKSTDCEHRFGLVWFGISSKQWRPLTYL